MNFARTYGRDFARDTYGKTAGFGGAARALTEDEMMRAAPSIFATEKHDSRSDRFAPIPTIEVLRALAKEGFSVVGCKQAVARSADRAPFTKHLVRLRNLNDDKQYRVGDNVPEMLLKNANDGSAAYNLMSGLFRIRCTNSLVAHSQTLDHTVIRHSGKPEAIIGRVAEATFRVIDNSRALLAAPENWSRIRLNQDEARAYATAAHMARFGTDGAEETRMRDNGITADALLAPRRPEDDAADLWTVFNTVQENAMRGGITGRVRDPETRRVRRVTTREVKGIDQDVKLNRMLWVFTEALATARGAAPVAQALTSPLLALPAPERAIA